MTKCTRCNGVGMVINFVAGGEGWPNDYEAQECTNCHGRGTVSIEPLSPHEKWVTIDR